MVTKQQQLEWLASMWTHAWGGSTVEYVDMSVLSIGVFCTNPIYPAHRITREEWQQERDKMQKQQDNSWHERGELPPVGCECLSPGGEAIMIASHGSISDVPVAFYPFGVSGLYSAACAKQFRPLRTEREKAIDEMIAAIDHIKEGNFQTFIGALYDAGYRKQ